jgi:beta-lactamase class A
MYENTKNKLPTIIGGVAILGIGILAGFYIPRFISSSTTTTTYQFINPTVSSNTKKHFIINFSPLRKQLVDIQKKYPQKTYIYFNYLNNGSWVGINEREDFAAASLVKVPLAMAVFKAVEEGKLSLDQTYTLEEVDLDSNFGDLYKSGPDSTFSVEELVKIMLEQSDNTARSALYAALERIGIQDPLYGVYSALGWDFLQGILPGANQFENLDPNLYNKINLKLLSNMLVSLYNAQYLNIEHSEQILEYLANSPFNDKIAAGVPADIAVAHKIGVSADSNTFSDCGIIYAPNRHYLLCLGSSGGDEKAAAKFMAEVSKAAYEYVINN